MGDEDACSGWITSGGLHLNHYSRKNGEIGGDYAVTSIYGIERVFIHPCLCLPIKSKPNRIPITDRYIERMNVRWKYIYDQFCICHGNASFH